MKKRLRKKLRLKEFQEMGFRVKFDLNIPHTYEADFEFLDRLIDVVEANHLLIGGSSNNFFVQTDSRRSATEADRQALNAWLSQQPEVANINISPLIDAWHGTFD